MNEFFEKYPSFRSILPSLRDMNITDETFYMLTDEQIQYCFKDDPQNMFSFVIKHNFEKEIFLCSNQNISQMEIVSTDTEVALVSAESNLEDFSNLPSEPKKCKLQSQDEFTFVENEIYFLLSSTLQGQVVLGKYKLNRTIDFPKLKSLVIYHYISQDPVHYIIKTKTFEHIANKIQDLMPTCDKDLLYVPYQRSNVNSDGCGEGGLLYWYYKECRKGLYEAGILKKKSIQENVTLSTSSTEENILSSDFVCLVDPDREKYNSIDVGLKWKESFDQRTKKLTEKEGKNFVLTPQNYIESFRCLEDSIALSLLESDFDRIIEKLDQDKIINKADVPSYNSLFQKNWPIVADGIVQIIKQSKVKEVTIFKKKHHHLIEQGQHNSLLALFALPLYIGVNKPLGKYNSLDSFIYLIQDPTELEEKRKDLKKKLESDSILQIIFCGTLENISKAYVILNDRIYTYSDPLKAVDICFKCHVALRSWPFACDYTWLFIQLCVYKIPNNKSPFFVNKAYQVVQRCIHNLKQFEKKT